MRAWFTQFGESSPVYGEPQEWHFDYPWEVVKRGFWMWAMSGFTRMPHHWEVEEYDPKWVGDMQLAQTLYAHKKNASAAMQLGERMVKAGKKFFGMGMNNG